MNGTLFFTANDGVHGSELWKSDGTAAGTVHGQGHQRRRHRLEPLGPRRPWASTLFFTANDGTTARSCGRATGRRPAPSWSRTSTPGSGGSSITNLTDVGGTLYFSAYTPAYGAELWKSDGTAAGTAMVQDIYAGSTGSSPTNLTAWGALPILHGHRPDAPVAAVRGRLIAAASDGPRGSGPPVQAPAEWACHGVPGRASRDCVTPGGGRGGRFCVLPGILAIARLLAQLFPTYVTCCEPTCSRSTFTWTPPERRGKSVLIVADPVNLNRIGCARPSR